MTNNEYIMLTIVHGAEKVSQLAPFHNTFPKNFAAILALTVDLGPLETLGYANVSDSTTIYHLIFTYADRPECRHSIGP